MNQPAHTFASDAHAEARRQFEARKLTQDGAIWPVRRLEMRHGPTIRTRMVEDLAAYFQAETARCFSAAWTLSAAGWTLDQIAAHGEQALAAHQDEVLRTKT
jgi:hypothetical protein